LNLLIITHAYAPDAAPRAFRWTAIAEHWAREGATVQVITTGRGGGEALEQRNGVVVHRVGEGFMGRMQRRAGVAGLSASRGKSTAHAAPSVLRRAVRAIYNATWQHVFWPDYACLWRRPALTRAKILCRAERFDAVISVSHPFTGHLVGLSLKRAIPELRWIVDIGDPFSLGDTVPSNNQTLYRGLNRRTEATVLRESDAISVTVAGCAEILSETFAVDPAKIQIIPPLLSLPDGSSADATPIFASADTIDLVYLGVLYPTLRPPDSLLALFAAMHTKHDALRLHFFGDIKGCEAAFERYHTLLGTAILVHAPIPREAVAATMAAADILVNIGNGTAHQLPSKLVEYIAAGRPILNIARSQHDTAAAFLYDHPAALSVTMEDGAPTTDQIDRTLGFLSTPPTISDAERDRLTTPFRVPAIASAFAGLVAKDGKRPVSTSERDAPSGARIQHNSEGD
jgi:glycosyltransferase involved in cell wall biosynthesis